MWETFKAYLIIDVKLRDSVKNLQTIKSKFIQLENYFSDKDLNRDNFNQYILELKEKGLAAPTINNTIKAAKHYDKFLKTLCIQDYTYFKERPPEITPLTPEEVVSMANIVYPYSRLSEALNFRDRVIINFLFDTGCRRGELENLLWVDLRDTPIPNVTFRDTKTGDDRMIPISEDLYDLLLKMPHYGPRVFDSRDGKMIDFTTFNRMLKARAEMAGITKPVYAHIFRHSRITQLANMPQYGDSAVMKFVGHKSFDTTLRYIHKQLQELAPVAYSSPFGQSGIPQATQGELLREFAKKILTKDQFVNIEYDKGRTVISIVG